MGQWIIKADRDTDLYLNWSSVVEAPTFVGTRAEMLEYLTDDYRPGTDRHAYETEQASKRLDRADETGTSAHPPWGCSWDDYGEIYMQRGTLRRKDMLAAARAWQADINDDGPVIPLLEPFEDDDDEWAGWVGADQ